MMRSSRGILSNKPQSTTCVWKVDFQQVPCPHSTVTVSLEPFTCRVMLTVTGTMDRASNILSIGSETRCHKVIGIKWNIGGMLNFPPLWP